MRNVLYCHFGKRASVSSAGRWQEREKKRKRHLLEEKRRDSSKHDTMTWYDIISHTHIYINIHIHAHTYIYLYIRVTAASFENTASINCPIVIHDGMACGFIIRSGHMPASYKRIHYKRHRESARTKKQENKKHTDTNAVTNRHEHTHVRRQDIETPTQWHTTCIQHTQSHA